MPVSSLKFLNDLSTSYAWYQVRNYNLETISNYIAMLKYNGASRFPGGTYPPPLKALHVPDDVQQDSQVAALSLRLFNSARAFTLAHELGHIYDRDLCRGRPGSFKEAQAREMAADRFALEIMRRDGNVPIGAFLMFLTFTYYEPNRGEFSTDLEWEKYLDSSTHPLSAARVMAAADFINAEAADYGANSAELIRQIAAEVKFFAHLLADPDQQRSIRVIGESTDLTALMPRHSGELVTAPQGWEKEQPSPSSFQGRYAGHLIRYIRDAAVETFEIQMLLRREGEMVNGRYAYGDISSSSGYAYVAGIGNISGAVIGGELLFEWTSAGDSGQSGSFGAASSGRGILKAVSGGDGLSGTWGYGDSRQGAGSVEARKQ